MPRRRHTLSQRESQIAQATAKGKTIAQIAKELGIKEGTVRDNQETIRNKMGERTSRAAAEKAIREGYIYGAAGQQSGSCPECKMPYAVGHLPNCSKQ